MSDKTHEALKRARSAAPAVNGNGDGPAAPDAKSQEAAAARALDAARKVRAKEFVDEYNALVERTGFTLAWAEVEEKLNGNVVKKQGQLIPVPAQQ